MAVDFYSPAQRANGGSGGLNVTVSPLGLIDLSDEEFQVHGARIARYAMNWSWYLGSHWASLREAGEPQLTFNWFRAFTDFHTNFTFGRGVTFKSPPQTAAIVPSLLNRVWTVDNNRKQVLWEMGQMGGVTGDIFVKVAYEEPQLWPPTQPGTPPPVGVKQSFLPGRVRLLVLNSSYCFPVWNPHDRSRLIQFTQKYRFWAPTADGTRQMKVYVEVITDTEIREYIDDQAISVRPNPLGFIPVVHIANKMISGSPWGLADCHDILDLNRRYNEVATEILDIVNYYTAPVTVLVGANQQTLQRGSNNMWSVPKGASVENLEGGQAGIPAALNMMAQMLTAMHSLVGIPEGALGQEQAVSNTAGVALAIKYQPTMQMRDQKIMSYGTGLEKINDLVLRTLAIKEPESGNWEPSLDEELKDGQLAELDWDDPITYRTEAVWESPLPIDLIRVLQEEAQKMAMGLQSKRGAFAKIGEEFPDMKALEVFNELVQDAVDQGALDMIQAQIGAAIFEKTGMMPPSGVEPEVQSAGGSDVTTAGAAGGAPGVGAEQGQPGRPAFTSTPEGAAMLAHLNARAMGTKLPGQVLPSNQ